ncbi:type II secretion system F family protein [Cellulosimicrobium sp. Marseille-Q4280]|uniref:type II secretion system F family protein n=1 Tax=Cellulosimicrobium sp. Marseille-Q4280 TaxID=2937992 RepID=UPI00203BF89F|nr:type II secretion system F family protein [Cellulosimicrobium sp. Marseille-Q4280]
MPQFDVRYLVGSTIVPERITADNEDEVRAGASLRGATLLSVKKVGTGMKMEIGGPKRVKPDELNQFVRMFATIVAADLSVLEALRMMSKEIEHPTLASAVDAVATDVDAGSSLAAAFERHPSVFPALLINAVSAAQSGGFLDTALLATADTLEEQAELAADVKQASTYPLTVLVVGILASVIMLVFLLPRFAGMFDELGGELPLLTRMVMAASEVVKWVAIPVAVLAAIAAVWWRRNKHRESVRRTIDPIKLRVPIFGPLARKLAVTRMLRTLGLLLESGVSMIEAIPKAAPTANNTVISGALLKAGEYVQLGEDLSVHLSDDGHIPTMASQMLRAGEKVGDPGPMLDRVAKFYHSEVSRATKKMSSTLEPILITTVGAMMGVQLLAMYLPMFSVFELIG